MGVRFRPSGDGEDAERDDLRALSSCGWGRALKEGIDMADRIKAIVTSALALGALAIPGFEALETALGGPDSIVQSALGGYALYHTIALAVDYGARQR